MYQIPTTPQSSPPEISVTLTDMDTDDRQRYALLLPWLVVLIANHLVRIAQYDFLGENNLANYIK